MVGVGDVYPGLARAEKPYPLDDRPRLTCRRPLWPAGKHAGFKCKEKVAGVLTWFFEKKCGPTHASRGNASAFFKATIFQLSVSLLFLHLARRTWCVRGC